MIKRNKTNSDFPRYQTYSPIHLASLNFLLSSCLIKNSISPFKNILTTNLLQPLNSLSLSLTFRRYTRTASFSLHEVETRGNERGGEDLRFQQRKGRMSRRLARTREMTVVDIDISIYDLSHRNIPWFRNFNKNTSRVRRFVFSLFSTSCDHGLTISVLSIQCTSPITNFILGQGERLSSLISTKCNEWYYVAKFRLSHAVTY